ncbi:hypothetical protein EX30DRAFT_340210 [Ascodesmis nigricans]|uniref:Uncharacterized protein n=1 Tax=Ascodesmis nigricans TaxID=341454 RepID=A0A4S2MYK2_9PEZI|nr:hypothetical protein EX30DRAFT_340210 [Ascodesmis nigricans]
MDTSSNRTLGAPGPTEEMVKETAECAAKCEQGDGSPEATQKFADCNNKCIALYYFSSTLGSAQKTGGSNGGSGNGDAKATGSAYVFLEIGDS